MGTPEEYEYKYFDTVSVKDGCRERIMRMHRRRCFSWFKITTWFARWQPVIR